LDLLHIARDNAAPKLTVSLQEPATPPFRIARFERQAGIDGDAVFLELPQPMMARGV
jgi:hypothetical protein